jgi:lipoprotein
MKKTSFILVAIILLSCNGNNSVRIQEHADVDSAVIDTMDVQPLKDESHKKLAKNNTADPIVGTYYCYRTQDTYVFLSDKTGYFTVQGGSPSDFTWKRSGKNVTIVYEVFGKQKLKFDSKAQTLTEESKSLGTLVFDKQ